MIHHWKTTSESNKLDAGLICAVIYQLVVLEWVDKNYKLKVIKFLFQIICNLYKIILVKFQLLLNWFMSRKSAYRNCRVIICDA